MVKRSYLQVTKIIEELPHERMFNAYDVRGLFIDEYGVTYAPNTVTIGYYLKRMVADGKVRRIKTGWYCPA